ncbi:MAG: RNA 3'-terminal phosphate cyclase [Myxococcales bacterium]|nr:RNA 3'-terminal phosphate cyclase [Myxococcales bacterium]
MSGDNLRSLLNRARWRDAGLHSLTIDVRHRGAPGDLRQVLGSRIAEVRAGGVELVPDSGEGDAVFVPYHRFVAVRGGDGVVLWTKDGRAAAAADGRATDTARPAAESEPGVEVAPTFSVVLRAASTGEPMVLDGSAGEGGGQILRTSLALSMITGTPFVLERIRARRAKPGLMRQHLTCVQAAAAISGAEVEGSLLGSARLAFRPGPVVGGTHDFDVGSAGSVALVLQTLALPLALASRPCRVRVRGGTHALWAPIHPFLDEAWLPLVRAAGAEVGLELAAVGFHPAGGGEVVLTTSPSMALAPIHLAPSSGQLALRAHAIVADLPESVARRELVALAEALAGAPLVRSSATVASPGPGNALWLSARDEGTGVTNVFSGIGERGVRAEAVGGAVAERFLAWRESGASVEEHLADQLMLPIALAGSGSFTCDGLSLHALTNIEVLHAFTGARLRAFALDGGARFRVALRA